MHRHSHLYVQRKLPANTCALLCACYKKTPEVQAMDAKRAREIAASPTMIDVTYNGSRIYIESVNDGKQSAFIHFMDRPAVRLEVPLAGLIEC